MIDINDISYIPTSDDIFDNLYKKYIINAELCKRAKNYDIFKIDGEEYIIDEIKDLYITFTSIKNDKKETRYIEDLEGILTTEYNLV